MKTRFQLVLEERILKRLSERADDLSRGVPVDNYNNQVGYCNGLRDALVLCEDIERELAQ